MTKLIVAPIDMAAAGSYAQRKRLVRAIAHLQDAQEKQRAVEMVGAFDDLEALVTAHLETDDGTPVADALEQLSANDFDQMVGALVTVETVPNPKSAP